MDTNEATETIDRSSDASGSTKISVENVRKRFGRIVALDGVTLDIQENEIFALIGDNGAGKSTLMNILSGVYEPTDGSISLDSEKVNFDSPSDARRAGIETVYQDLALMNDLDIPSNVFMGQFPTKGIGALRIIDWDETRERTEAIIHDQLDRDIALNTEVEFLSGGERQLVAIGRSLAFDPDVIVLDEPTSALSIDATNLVHQTIRRLKNEGHTILIVSHSIEDVLDLADRIGILFKGQLVDVTDPSEVDIETLTNLIVSGKRVR
ncbi:ATP-binding cassette domain-containing protein [Halocatena marina]|uniref:ATP-binding cassette domain-containing protein n=1 Tax=Halocatena marina TaxID=2934937 RepID=A0ABD5YJE5_9EURY|nr:ATP-binding cassette domain-containing protein [Halocatena marina]